MNIQREAIYKKRNNALSGERLSVDLNTMFTGLCESLVADHKQRGDFESFRTDSMRLLGLDVKMDPVDFKEGSTEEVSNTFYKQLSEAYSRKAEQISQLLLPVIERVQENEGHKYKRIAIPYTDGSKNPLPIAADMQEAIDTKGASIIKDIEKTVTLSLIDGNWKEHLRSMDELKDSSQGASFEQKDPLVIYKMEAYNLFEELIYHINEKVSSYLLKGKMIVREEGGLQEARERKTDLSKTQTNKSAAAARAAAEGVSRNRQKPATVKRQEQKVGRNDPCPCGSGKKFKQCHGKA